VDYDNDGLPDLFSFPQGLFRQRSDHTFEQTGLLAFDPEEYPAAVANWFDLDNDGKRDLLLAVNPGRSGKRPWWRVFGQPKEERPRGWQLKLFRNVGASGHWLQVRVGGTNGNRQAIGARVTVVTRSGTQTQEVGGAEGAFFSKGHYRTYFGLGADAQATAVRVRWPDGHEKELRDVKGDRLLVVDRDAAR
jgi:hypothetical protein